jgi:D-3-phosphoglycerate dehydrogenase
MTVCIGISDYVSHPFEIERSVFPSSWDVRAVEVCDSAALRHCDALMVWHALVDSKVVDGLGKCKIVVRYGAGYENVDVQALSRAGILFSNNPEYGVSEVADTAVGMILGWSRGLILYDSAARTLDATWQENICPHARRSSETTVGVIGVGRIGTATIRRLSTLGFRVLGYDPYLPHGAEDVIGFVRVHSLEEVLRSSDVVSLHCPETPMTKGMVDAHFLALMKRGSALVNTARGGLLQDLDVLERALREGHLSSALLDVLPQEPPESHSLIQAWRDREPWLSGRLFITPHTAYYSRVSWPTMRRLAAETVRMYLEEGIHRYAVTDGVMR